RTLTPLLIQPRGAPSKLGLVWSQSFGASNSLKFAAPGADEKADVGLNRTGEARMTSTRFLLSAVAATALAGPVFAQPGSAYQGLVPSVRPVGAEEPVAMPPRRPMVPNVRPAAAVDSLEGMTAP